MIGMPLMCNLQFSANGAYATHFSKWIFSQERTVFMVQTEKTDLRVQKTNAAIKRAFTEMILELEPGDITVKELAQRADPPKNLLPALHLY